MAYYYDQSGEFLAYYTECCLNDDDKPCNGVIMGEEYYEHLKAKIDAAYESFQEEVSKGTQETPE